MGEAGSLGGTGTAVAPPLTAGAPALAAPDLVPLAAPLAAAPPAGLLPSRGPARPTDLPGVLVVVAAVAVAAVGAGQVTEVVARRRSVPAV